MGPRQPENPPEEEPRKSLYLSPIAKPLITDKLLGRALKLLKKAAAFLSAGSKLPVCRVVMGDSGGSPKPSRMFQG